MFKTEESTTKQNVGEFMTDFTFRPYIREQRVIFYAKGLFPKLTRKGIENWQHLRPWNAFLPRTSLTPGGTLQTLPTPAAGAAVPLLSLLIDKLKKKK